MNFPVDYMYRLVGRGGAGLACDESGVALGAAELARVRREAGGARRCEVRSPGEIDRILKAAYGPQPDAIVQRLHRGLRRTAARLEAGELCHAGIEAVMLGFPDLTPSAVAKLAEIADLEKAGKPWEDEPRLPKRQTGGGQWTTGGGGGAATAVKPLLTPAPLAPPKPPAPTAQSEHPASPPDDHVAPADTGTPHLIAAAEVQTPGEQPAWVLDDGVYRPAVNTPRRVSVATPPKGEGEPYLAEGAARETGEAAPFSFGLPPEVTDIEQQFSGLKQKPFETAAWDPSPQAVDLAALADDLGPSGAARIYHDLQDETKAIDPKYNDAALFPEGGFTSLSEAERHRVIDETLMDRASAYYRMRGDPRKLQIETVKFLQKEVDKAYADAEQAERVGKLKPSLTRQLAFGNFIDKAVRSRLTGLYKRYSIPFGPRQRVTINNRDYDTSSGQATYKVPDARIDKITIDWTVRNKTLSDPQVQGFLRADSTPKGVIIIKPSQMRGGGARYIPRPPNFLRKINNASSL